MALVVLVRVVAVMIAEVTIAVAAVLDDGGRPGSNGCGGDGSNGCCDSNSSGCGGGRFNSGGGDDGNHGADGAGAIQFFAVLRPCFDLCKSHFCCPYSTVFLTLPIVWWVSLAVCFYGIIV